MTIPENTKYLCTCQRLSGNPFENAKRNISGSLEKRRRSNFQWNGKFGRIRVKTTQTGVDQCGLNAFVRELEMFLRGLTSGYTYERSRRRIKMISSKERCRRRILFPFKGGVVKMTGLWEQIARKCPDG